ncbi:MAG: hypothetical protein PUJ05_09365 [Clostridium sp.]|uniref:hypothetical protein n=1 Tax=Clostridium sp. TaxID=1506 RepID=UPI002672DEC0|nr:hypothetical protein [Clostridium sp.]MDD7683141.1 hypothetical protein [Clostridium sp.]MDY2581263.1 hypothetical protein [Clostridium sp.]
MHKFNDFKYIIVLISCSSSISALGLFFVNPILGFLGLIHAQPVTESIIMFFAISSLWKNIKNIEKQSQLSVKEDK